MSWSKGPPNRHYTFDNHELHMSAYASDTMLLGAWASRKPPDSGRRPRPAWPSRISPPGTIFVLVTPVVLLLMVLASWLQGDLTQTGLGELLRRDASRILGDENLALSEDTQLWRFTLLRDLTTIILAMAASINVPIIYRQWAIFETFFRDLHIAQVMEIQVGYEKEFNEAFARMNNFFNRTSSKVGVSILFVTTFISVAFVVTNYNEGVFFGLAPLGIGVNGAQEWGANSYRDWWAGESKWPFGWIVYALVAGLAIYYMLLQNAVGFRFVGFVVSQTWRQRIRWVLNPANPDGRYGYAPLGRLLATVYASTLIHLLIVLGTVTVMIGEVNQALIVPIGVLAMSGPVYLTVPILILIPVQRRYKAELLAELWQSGRSRIEEADGADEKIARAMQLNERAKAIGRMSANPFSGSLIGGAVIYVVPIVSLAVLIVLELTK